MLGLPDDGHACLFDVDAVLTDTAAVHNLAWVLDVTGLAELRAAGVRR